MAQLPAAALRGGQCFSRPIAVRTRAYSLWRSEVVHRLPRLTSNFLNTVRWAGIVHQEY